MMDAGRGKESRLSQEASDKRKFKYRQLLEKIEEIEDTEDLGIDTVNQLSDVFKAVAKVNDECDIKDRVEHADETLLDALVLSNTSDILLNCVKAAHPREVHYDPSKFAQDIVNYVKTDTGSMDFSKLFEAARSIIPEVPKFTSLYGAFDPAKVKPPKERKTHVKEVQEDGNKEVLIPLSNDGSENANTINFLLKVLKEEYAKNQNKPINYYKYLVDKESFASTVENMFYFSFLLRDGKAMLLIENGKPVVAPVKKQQLQEFREFHGVDTQMIMSFDMDMWEKINVTEGYVQMHKKNLEKA